MIRISFRISFILIWILALPLVASENNFVTFSVKSFQTRPASSAIFYGEDIAGALNNSLQGVPGLKIFERNANWTFLEELKLSMSGMTDDSRPVQQAAIISPDYFIEGEVTLSGDQMVIRARIYEISSREILYAKTVRGGIDNYFDLEEELTADLTGVFSQLDFKTRQIKEGSFERSAYDFYNQSLKNQSVEDRIVLLTESLKKEPDFIQALHLLASTYDEAQMRPECLNTYGRILELDPSDFTARWNQGINAFKLMDYDLAVQAFEACGKLHPGDPEVWYNLGVCAEYNEQGQRFGAGVSLTDVIPRYEKVLEAAPGHENTNFALGFLYGQLASSSQIVEEQQKLIRKAIQHWTTFITVAPDNPNLPEVQEHVNLFSHYLDQIEANLAPPLTTNNPQ